MSKVIDWVSRIHDVGRWWRVFLDIRDRGHRSVGSECGVDRRHVILRGGGDVATQRDAVVGILVSGEQSICWRRWRVVQGDHVPYDGGRAEGRRGVRYIRRDIGRGSRRGSLDRFVSRGGEREKGVGWLGGLRTAAGIRH